MIFFFIKVSGKILDVSCELLMFKEAWILKL